MEIGEPQLGRAEFLAMLRAMVGAMHRLSLGTLDSFFARVVRAFPLELGLGGDFEILQEHGARLERQRVLRQLFARTGGELDDAQKEFVEAFKRATFGAEEKRLSARLDRFIDQHQVVYLEAPDGEAWGNPRRIWPAGTQWLQAAGDTKGAAAVLRAWAAGACANEKQRKRWDDFLDEFAAWAPGAMLAKPLDYLLKSALGAWAQLGEEPVEMMVERKKQVVPVEPGAALKVLVRALFAGELTRRLEMTRGIYTVLRGYEAIYNERVRRAGKLTFADVQRLLMPESGAPRLAAAAEATEGGRLLVDWRLDAKFDHWLLDEFQDTSHGQWSVLRNLIDEAVQDPEGRRSFFYVGDVKQAIYAWRGGDPRLFREIFDHYNAVQPGTIEEGRLNDSWRSGPAVVAAVNRVFGNAEALARLLPAATAERWTREWGEHVSAKPKLGGQVLWLHGEDEEARWAATLRLLVEIDPLERGLSVAVLTQSNDVATRLADYLRREGGLPAMAASDLHVCTDNPLTTAMLALLQAAAHPGDRFAWEHVLMTPLAGLLSGESEGAREALTRGVSGQVHADGFARTVEAWFRRLEPVQDAEDEFSRERARQLIEAAQAFDATGSRDVAEFVQFAGRHVVRDAETAVGVRVMTVHKSKGLGFDVVVLPDLEGNSLATRRSDGLAVQRSAEREVEWVLDLPPKLFYENDVVLAAHAEEGAADAGYEKLCLFYVAMTRAKRALYLVTKEPSEKSQSDNFPRLLAATLGAAVPTAEGRVGTWSCEAVYAEGDEEWFKADDNAVVAGGDGKVDLITLGIVPDTAVIERHPSRTPSGEKTGVVAGAALFGEASAGAASFGTALHRALAEVEWWAGVTPELSKAWVAAGLGETVIAEVKACLGAAELAEVFARKDKAEVWRERRFEIVIDGAWITGVFDRVVLERGMNGLVIAVTVYDFKTDRVDTSAVDGLAERYAWQMGIYRRAAARLTGVSEVRVRCVLVSTSQRRLIEATLDGAD